MDKFSDLCESFGIIKQTKRIMYPRQIKLSEEFMAALKGEYYRLTIEEDNDHPIKNRPQKFLKALQFHVQDLESNKEAELEALRNMMDESGQYKYNRDEVGLSVDDHYDEKGRKVKVNHKDTKQHKRGKKQLRQLKHEIGMDENTEDYEVTVDGEKQEGNKVINTKAEARRRKQIDAENAGVTTNATVASESKFPSKSDKPPHKGKWATPDSDWDDQQRGEDKQDHIDRMDKEYERKRQRQQRNYGKR